MCLIVYSPTGDLIERDVFECAREINPDGVGVMSSHGVEKFIGKSAGKKAWRYIRQLAASRIPYGIHFRMATHGDVTRENCHPFHVPNSDALVMHNGILDFAAEYATPARSDTSIFVDWYMSGAPGPEASEYERYYRSIGATIGIDNKFLIFHTLTGHFTICNESSGEWIGELWYSNPYSLPWALSGGFDGLYETGFRGAMDDWDRMVEEELGEWTLYYDRVTGERQYIEERMGAAWERLRHIDD
jgi:hypothetical protein